VCGFVRCSEEDGLLSRVKEKVVDGFFENGKFILDKKGKQVTILKA